MNWDNRWLAMAELVASWSKDRSRKVGAVIVGPRQELLSVGWNGFPRGVDDGPDERHERPAKYRWTVHAETNAIYNAAAHGVGLRGATLYVGGDITWPCAGCAGAIVQAGIVELVADYENEPDADVAWAILEEGSVRCRSARTATSR